MDAAYPIMDCIILCMKHLIIRKLSEIFDKRMHGKVLCMTEESENTKQHLLIELGKSYTERNWVMQLHYGVQRDLNSCYI